MAGGTSLRSPKHRHFCHAYVPASRAPVSRAPWAARQRRCGDPQQEYFSDGITDLLINGLSRVPGLFVIARTSSFESRQDRYGGDKQMVSLAKGGGELPPARNR